MRIEALLATLGVLIAATAPAAAAPGLRAEQKGEPRAMLERAGAALSSPVPVGTGPAPTGLRLTTATAGAASAERIEGRLETRTSLVTPQLGCWRAWRRGFFLGLELGWSVASSAPARADASDARRGGGLSGLAGLARPITSLVHFGWSR